MYKMPAFPLIVTVSNSRRLLLSLRFGGMRAVAKDYKLLKCYCSEISANDMFVIIIY